ncbi:cytochrome b5 heme-binding domain-containing protein, partial [Haematococcus lacustris]
MVKTEDAGATLVIDGWQYDVAEFARKHPGGSVIRFYYGQDATDAFHNFHRNAPRARKWLEKLPRKPVEPAQKSSPESIDVDAEFRAWQQSLQDRGFFKPSFTRIGLQCLEPLVMVAAACLLMAQLPGATGLLLALPLIAMANVKCGWIQHEGGHTSLTTNPKVDKVIQAVAIGLGLSTCGWQWNRMHNRHHATPQKINHDMDLDTLPLVGFFHGCLEKTRMSLGIPVSRLWLRLQAWTFIPVVCGAVLWMYWVYSLHLRAALQHDWKSLAFMLLSHVVKPALFVVFGGTTWLQGYGLFLLTYWLTGMYLFGHFSLSHSFTPVVEDTDHKSWNPVVSRELQGLAKRWGLDYQCVSYAGAWSKMLGNLDK